MTKVTTSEVHHLLSRIAYGEVVPQLDKSTKHYAWRSGNVAYICDGWRVVIFWDSGDWDYVDSVISPDGRTGQFEDWWPELDDYFVSTSSPLATGYRRMVNAFENAT